MVSWTTAPYLCATTAINVDATIGTGNRFVWNYADPLDLRIQLRFLELAKSTLQHRTSPDERHRTPPRGSEKALFFGRQVNLFSRHHFFLTDTTFF